MKNIFLQYFIHPDKQRRAEIDYCVKHSLKNKNFNKYYILLEKAEDIQEWMNNDNFIIYNFDKRPTVKDIIEYINSVSNNDDINILPNSDIFFDDTINYIDNINSNDFITLTRWNIDVNTKQATFFNVNCSQDVWIWRGVVDYSNMNIDWYMGLPGIDNLLCGAFYENNYRVLNPSLLIKTYHLHQETTRSYTDKDVVKGRLYFLYPTNNLNDSLIKFWKETK